MTPVRFNTFCSSLPHTTYVCQWGGSHVWKIGGKVFAIGSPEGRGVLHVTFKCSPLAFEVLKGEPGCRPAPYLASRGMLWIQRTGPGYLDDAGLKQQLRESYRLVADGLSKAARHELGLETGTPSEARRPRRAARTPRRPPARGQPM